MKRRVAALISAMIALTMGSAAAQAPPPNFVREQSPVIAITHVSVIDGTGAAARADQTVIIDHGRIATIGSSRRVRVPAGAAEIDGHGKSLIPGLVGMHEHLFVFAPVSGPAFAIEQPVTAPLLYLASGVTTARTAGSIDPYYDLAIQRGIESGAMIGPNLDLSTPYLEGSPPALTQLYPLRNAEDARTMLRYWRGIGFNSVKAYAEIAPDVLQAAIEEAHRLGMKVTGHLCSVGYEQAVAFGIDNLEHGPFVSPDGELDPARELGLCRSPAGQGQGAIGRDIVPTVEPDSPPLRHLIQVLVAHHVPITSTLSVIEGGSHLDLSHNPRLRTLMAPVVWTRVNTARENALARDALVQMRLRKEMAFERAFAAAGGILMAGCDPTGDSHTIAGLGDQRNIELLVEAGFSVPQAIRIATQNGATYEGIANETGSIATGKRADLVLLDGDLARDVSAIQRPEIVFKAGVGYDSEAIYASLAGQVGLH